MKVCPRCDYIVMNDNEKYCPNCIHKTELQIIDDVDPELKTYMKCNTSHNVRMKKLQA